MSFTLLRSQTAIICWNSMICAKRPESFTVSYEHSQQIKASLIFLFFFLFLFNNIDFSDIRCAYSACCARSQWWWCSCTQREHSNSSLQPSPHSVLLGQHLQMLQHLAQQISSVFLLFWVAKVHILHSSTWLQLPSSLIFWSLAVWVWWTVQYEIKNSWMATQLQSRHDHRAAMTGSILKSLVTMTVQYDSLHWIVFISSRGGRVQRLHCCCCCQPLWWKSFSAAAEVVCF